MFHLDIDGAPDPAAHENLTKLIILAKDLITVSDILVHR